MSSLVLLLLFANYRPTITTLFTIRDSSYPQLPYFMLSIVNSSLHCYGLLFRLDRMIHAVSVPDNSIFYAISCTISLTSKTTLPPFRSAGVIILRSLRMDCPYTLPSLISCTLDGSISSDYPLQSFHHLFEIYLLLLCKYQRCLSFKTRYSHRLY